MKPQQYGVTVLSVVIGAVIGQAVTGVPVWPATLTLIVTLAVGAVGWYLATKVIRF